MKKWEKLISYEQSIVQRGTLLKFPAGQSFEGSVVMMVCEAPMDSSGTGLISITGYKSGINCYVIFPKIQETSPLSTQWLVANWNDWVWPDGDINEILIRPPLQAEEL